jgi:carbonic anhydrase/acetyltransferase-like protein (isoleucine patch superfamily)
MIRPFLDVHPHYDGSNFIAPSADVIGDVTLGRGASIWFNATVRGDVNWIRIGDASNVQDNAVLHVTNRTAPTDVGAHVTIGHSAVVHGCTVEDNVLIGIGAVVLDHAVVGRDSIIGAKALVTTGMQIPPRSMVLGVPARVVRTLRDDEVEKIGQYAAHYVRYAAIYRGEDVPDVNPFYERSPA